MSPDEFTQKLDINPFQHILAWSAIDCYLQGMSYVRCNEVRNISGDLVLRISYKIQ